MENAIAIISDIHSNFQALTAVLDDVRSQEVSQIVCLGDIIGYASSVEACLRSVHDLGCALVLGNHDEAACLPKPPTDFNDTAAAGIIYSAARLSESDRAWMMALPRTLEIHGVVFTHASLGRSSQWPYIVSSEEASEHFSNQLGQLAFCGHTHKPMLWCEEKPGGEISQRNGRNTMNLPPSGKVLVNVGAVGQPRDGDPRACYAIYRPDQSSVEFRRVNYDIKRTRRKILRAGLPRFTAQRLSLGR